MKDLDSMIWVEKYRPKAVADCVLPKSLKAAFTNIVKDGKIPNMLFCGSAGTGKTTVAKAICNELDLDYIIINGSMDANMELLRTKIKQFASTVSFGNQSKVIILDEADYLNPQVQASLRGFIEEFSGNCRFILTCNFKNRIIEPLHSRCSGYDFSIPKGERPTLAGEIFARSCYILDQESIPYNKAAVAQLIEKHFPDFRRVLNEMQRYSISGEIDAGILVNSNDQNIKAVVELLKNKDFGGMRKWVADNMDMESHVIFRALYDNSNEYIEPNSIPQLVITLGEYQYKAQLVADVELNTVACLTELMAQLQWK